MKSIFISVYIIHCWNHNFIPGFTQHAAVRFGSMDPTAGRILLTLVGEDQSTDSIQITRSVLDLFVL